MTTRLVPMRIGGTDLLVEATVLPGTQQTSALDDVGQKVVDILDSADQVIVDVAKSVVGTLDRIADRATRPDRLEVEFGFKIAVNGGLIFASTSGEANLRVLLAYDRRPATDEPTG